MSPSWRERVRIALSLKRVALVRLSRGWKPAVSDRKIVQCGPAPGGAAWGPAVEALRKVLAYPSLRAAQATIVLSNHFVRYLLIPWNPSLTTEAEELAFARMRFVKVYGEAAHGWMLKISGATPGTAQVASAIERPLLDAVTAALGDSPLRLRSVQPGLMAVCNSWRATIARDAWIALAEPGRLLLGLLRAGQWQSLRGRPLNGEASALAEVLEQERLLLGIEPGDEKIYLHEDADCSLDVEGLKVERLSGRGRGAEAAGAW